MTALPAADCVCSGHALRLSSTQYEPERHATHTPSDVKVPGSQTHAETSSDPIGDVDPCGHEAAVFPPGQ
eukprot:422012-Rhodomonas_salina.2